MRLRNILLISELTFLSAAVSLTGVALAADKDLAQLAFISKDSADADFIYQGEYSGEIVAGEAELKSLSENLFGGIQRPGKSEQANDSGTCRKYGVQVIALGDGNFRAIGYHGGLPGDGWNQKDRVEIEARKIDKAIVFKSEKVQGVLTHGVFDIQSPDGKSLGKLKKVERKSNSLGRKPPAGAVVLFDGTSAVNFKEGRMTKAGLLIQGATSKQKFSDFELHLEFMLSYMPYGRSQDRSNSGCYLQGRYEVQILDSFGLSGEDNECGSIYSVRKPDVNMCYPPLSWQTYDIKFFAAKFDAQEKKIANARLSVVHNGVPVQVDVEVPKATRAAPFEEGPSAGPIYLQNHNCPVRYRNIWLVEL